MIGGLGGPIKKYFLGSEIGACRVGLPAFGPQARRTQETPRLPLTSHRIRAFADDLRCFRRSVRGFQVSFRCRICDMIFAMNSRRSSQKMTLSQMRQRHWRVSLPGYELDECSYDAVELGVQPRVLLNVAAHDRDLQARERLAS